MKSTVLFALTLIGGASGLLRRTQHAAAAPLLHSSATPTVPVTAAAPLPARFVTRCPSGCSGRGRCVGGRCQCFEGYSGSDCGIKSCPNACSRNGECFNGVCFCYAGWAGVECRARACPSDCAGHGQCRAGTCACSPGWSGAACKSPKCANECSHHGKCIDGACACASDWYGDDCSSPACPANALTGLVCSGAAGECGKGGACTCRPGYKGADCGTTQCPNDCSDHGICHNFRCSCSPGFAGADCSVKQCAPQCKRPHGWCDTSDGEANCRCLKGWTNEILAPSTVGTESAFAITASSSARGNACQKMVCPNDCSQHGSCVNFKCACRAPWLGAACDARACPDDCSGRGTCRKDGTCDCATGYWGLTCAKLECPGGAIGSGGADVKIGSSASGALEKAFSRGSKRVASSPYASLFGKALISAPAAGAQRCAGHGRCRADGVCECDRGFGAEDCSARKCPNDCAGHGECRPNTGRCVCSSGWTEADCSFERCSADPAIPNCSGRGKCVGGSCLCPQGWTGRSCEHRACPSECNGHGSCDVKRGSCECAAGWRGESCDARHVVPHHGYVTANNSAFCFALWTGPECESRKCPRDCSNRGKCVDGVCQCPPRWTGIACHRHGCPNQCFGHGACNIDGVCKCDEGYRNESCNVRFVEHGHCNAATGLCTCSAVVAPVFAGQRWSGAACDRKTCPSDCSARGECQRDGQCACLPGWTGADCTLKACLNECSYHGMCGTAGGCLCDAGWRGLDCSTPFCAGEATGCSGHGQCAHNHLLVENRHGSSSVGSEVAMEEDEDAAEAAGAALALSVVGGSMQRGRAPSFMPLFCQCDAGWVGVECETKLCGSHDCGGHGSCVNGECRCEPGWTIARVPSGLLLPKGVSTTGLLGGGCTLRTCPNNCNGRGACVAGKCVCASGFDGDDCLFQECPKSVQNGRQCGGHGACSAAHVCECMEGYMGAACDEKLCPGGGDCFGRGVCNTKTGVCGCYPGWSGAACDLRSCPNVCNYHGTCLSGKCICNSGYAGVDCAARSCLGAHGKCNGHGICSASFECVCDAKWEGDDCAAMTCPKSDDGRTCGGHGDCDGKSGECLCQPGWTGDTCVLKACPNECSYHGVCLEGGACKCSPGFKGADCSVRYCPQNCNGHGVCGSDDKCTCDRSFEGVACEIKNCIDDFMCHGHGVCEQGKCFCPQGWGGPDCNVRACPKECSYHGVCRKGGRCECDAAWAGEACDLQQCPNECSNHGECNKNTMQCTCHDGWGADDCGRQISCPDHCSGHGVCAIQGDDAVCDCHAGWAGSQCAYPACPAASRNSTVECSGHGKCDEGHCLCANEWTGDACQHATCPNSCNGNGECVGDVCHCNAYFKGADCSVRQCPLACSAHGVCHGSSGAVVDATVVGLTAPNTAPFTCSCFAGFTGEACNMRECLNGCSGHGFCKLQLELPSLSGGGQGGSTGGSELVPLGHALQPSSSASSSQCVCNNGWSGVDCGERACPDDCSRHGECHAGICRCDLAWTGENCAAPRCDADCHGHGSCTKGVCKCFADWSFDSNCAYPSCPRGRHGAANARSLSGVGSHHGTVSVGIGEECSRHGLCYRGTCHCDASWMGQACDVKRCPTEDYALECSGHGTCSRGACTCDSGFGGLTCGATGPHLCPNDCSGRGKCDAQTGTCACERGEDDVALYLGPDCAQMVCPRHCSSHGECIDGLCDCANGYAGQDCSVRLCPADCSGHGYCNDGVCFCVSPFSGNDCASDRGGRGGAAALLWSGSNAGLGLGANSNPNNPHDNCALKCTTSCTAKCSGKKFLCYKACTAPCYRACTNSVGGSSFLEVGASDSAQAQGFATIATQTRRRAPSGTMLRRHNAALRN